MNNEGADTHAINVCQRQIRKDCGALRKFQTIELSLCCNCQILVRKNDTLWSVCGSLKQRETQSCDFSLNGMYRGVADGNHQFRISRDRIDDVSLPVSFN